MTTILQSTAVPMRVATLSVLKAEQPPLESDRIAESGQRVAERGAGSLLLDSLRQRLRLAELRQAQQGQQMLAPADGDDGLADLLALQDALQRAGQRDALASALHSRLQQATPLRFDAPALQDVIGELRQMAAEDRIANGILSGQLDEQPGADAPPLGSHQDFFADIIALLGELNGDWLTRFSDLLTNYVGIFEKITAALGKLADVIGDDPGKDGNLKVNFDVVIEALKVVMAEIANGPGLGGDFATEAEAKAFLAELGLDGFIIKRGADGKWDLHLDTKMIQDLIDVFPTGDLEMNPARYNAIITAKDGLLERFNHINRVLPDKHQRQLQLWDSLVKTLSGTINSVTEVDRLFAQNLT